MKFRSILGVLLGCGLCSLLACGADNEARPGGSAGGSMGMTTGAGTGGAVSGGGGGGAGGKPGTSSSSVDDGFLFKDAGSVSSILADAGAAAAKPDAGPATAPEAGGSAIPGDGNMATGKVSAYGIVAVFTQKGLNVTLEITATRCPPGMHTFTIHEGFACDDPTKGPVWGGGKRGGGIPPLVCDAMQRGTLSYTRTSEDPATMWTVADHNPTTDLTLHPLMADSQCGTFF